MAAVDGGLGVYAAAPLFRVSVSYILHRPPATDDVVCKLFTVKVKNVLKISIPYTPFCSARGYSDKGGI